MLVRIYTDGSARGNPDGPGGYGAVLKYVDPKGTLHEREFSQGYVRTTNNRDGTYGGDCGPGSPEKALRGGALFRLPVSHQGLQRALDRRLDQKRLDPREKRASEKCGSLETPPGGEGPHQVTFIWVKGHAGHPENERCDALATQAADGDNRIVDPGV